MKSDREPFLQEITQLWWDLPTQAPDFGQSYSLSQQIANGRMLEKLQDDILTALKESGPKEPASPSVQEKITQFLLTMVITSTEIQAEHIQAVRDAHILENSVKFSEQARRFDPSLTESDIYQASRNIWTFNILQCFFNLPVSLTPAMFAYSLLYPYTDNYLDNPHVSLHTKMSFNERFRNRLEGKNSPAENSQEKRIYELIEIIEHQIDRAQNPAIYQSLMSILNAQRDSVSLMKKDASPYELDILGLSFTKGAASVIADGYLISSELTNEQRRLLNHFGAFTQLWDDLEDLQEDQRAGQRTIFTQTAPRWPLDAITNRTFHFGQALMDRIKTFQHPGNVKLIECFQIGFTPFFIYSSGKMSRYFSTKYRLNLQNHFPYRFSLIERVRKRLLHAGIRII
ncbi:MAG: hypothetical protein H6Q37_389 [Chloroflexi bacterium]|nr:hypothetical protein [Chloroflexota bacterium]